MHPYETEHFEPPAPVAYVTVKSADSEIHDLPMLIDTGADITLLPKSQLTSLLSPHARHYELEAFDGSKTTAPAITAELHFLGKNLSRPVPPHCPKSNP